MTVDTHTIHSGGLTATIKAQGAEMCSLKHKDGTEFVGRQVPPGRAMHRCCFRSSGVSPMTKCGTGARRTG